MQFPSSCVAGPLDLGRGRGGCQRCRRRIVVATHPALAEGSAAQGTVPLVRLARLDAADAAGPAPREAAAAAVSSAARVLAAAARAGGAGGGGVGAAHGSLPRTGELDESLSRDPDEHH